MQQLVNVGTVANDGTGDPLRNAYIKLNANDAELYSLLDREIKTIVKNSHGFISGNVLYLDNTGIFQKITSPSTQIPIGIVQTVIDANTFQIVEAGYVTSLSGLTAGTIYYVQATGLLGTGTTALRYFIADSTISGYILSGSGGSSIAIGGLVTSGTPGSVLFIDNSGLLGQDNANFYYNNTAHLLSVFTNGDFTGTDAINVYNEVDAYKPNSSQGVIGSGSESGFTFSTSRGTGTVPIVNNSGDLLGGVSGWGYTGSSPSYQALAGVWATALGVASTLGGKLDFQTRADGGSLTSRMTIDNTGTVSISALNTNSLIKTIGGTGTLALATAGADYLAPNGSGAALTGVWLLASGGALTANNNISGNFNVTFSLNNLTITQNTLSSGFTSAQIISPGAHTNITASTEQLGSFFKINAATQQWTSGSLTTQRFVYFGAPTISFTSASTATDVYNVYIEAPVAGLNAAITNAWGLAVNGMTKFTGGSPEQVLSIGNSQTNRVFIGTGQGGGFSTNQPFISFGGSSLGGSAPQIVSDGASSMSIGGTGLTLLTIRKSGTQPIVILGAGQGSTASNSIGISWSAYNSGGGLNATSGNYSLIQLANPNSTNAQFNPSSGNATIGILDIIQTFNTTGTYSGSTFGLKWNPTRTSVTGLTEYPFISSSAVGATVLHGFGTLTPTAVINAVTPASSSNWKLILQTTPGAYTSLTTATEFINNEFDGATWTWVDGTTTTQRFNYFKGFTLNKTTTSATFTNTYTVYIDPSTAGTGVTLTNNWALGLNGALQLYAGTTTMPPLVFQAGTNSTTIINGAIEFDGTHFWGSISGARVQLDNQVAASGWLANGATTITANTSQTGAFTETMSFNSVTINQNVITGANLPSSLTVNTSSSSTLSGVTSNCTTLAVNTTVKSLQFNTGSVSQLYTTFLAGNNTYSFVGATTLAIAANLIVSGTPNPSTNATITDSHVIYVPNSTISGSGTATNSYGLTINAQSGATNNWSAQLLGGIGVKITQSAQTVNHTFISITQSAHTSGTPTGFLFTGGAHTTLTAAEVNTVNFAVNQTIQFTGSTGFTTQRMFFIQAPTYAFAAATGTITTAATVAISGAPSAGTNAAITTPLAIWIQGGNSQFDGTNVVLKHIVGNTSAPTIASGTGAGTSPTVSISGTDLSGFITVTTGTAPTLSATVVTVTFNVAYTVTPKTVLLTPANSNASLLNGVNMVFVNQAGITTTTFAVTSGTMALTGSTTYVWYYTTIQ